MALLDIFKRGAKSAGKNLENYIGGLLGEDLSQLSEEERKQIRKQGMSAVFDAMARGTTATQGLAGVAQLAGARIEQKRLQGRQKAAEDEMGRITGRLFGEDLSARVITPEEAVKMGNPKLAGTIRPRQQIGLMSELDTGELSEVTPTSRYIADPQDAIRRAMTPAGIDAMQMNPMLSGVLNQYIKPKEQNLTDDQREYMAAVSQGYRGTFMEYLRDLKSAGATRLSVSTGDKGESKAQEVLAGAEATALSADRNAARSSLRVWGGAQTLIDLSTKPGAVAGSLAPGVMGANDFLVSIFGRGVAPEAMADAAKFNAAVSQLVIDQMSALGGARGFSREETALLERSFPQIATSPQARIAIARLLQAKAEENINAYNESLNDFKTAFPGVRTSLKPISIPQRNVAPPPGTKPAGNIREGG